jgi:hypothetical protein
VPSWRPRCEPHHAGFGRIERSGNIRGARAQHGPVERADTVPVDDDERAGGLPPFGSWWLDPAGLMAPALPVLPVAALESLLRAVGKRLTGRRLTVPGTGGALRLRLTALRLDPEPLGLAIGQLGDVRVEATDIEWRDVTFRSAVLVARNVHVRPQPVPTAVSAPVTLDVVVDPAVVRDRLTASHPALRLSLHRDAPQARAHWARHPEWGWVGLQPEITTTALLLRPCGVDVRGRSRALPAWLPTVRIGLPQLPRGLRLRDVAVQADTGIVLHLATDEWREPVPPRRLAALLTRVQRF